MEANVQLPLLQKVVEESHSWLGIVSYDKIVG
jgi:hypothetical protein